MENFEENDLDQTYWPQNTKLCNSNSFGEQLKSFCLNKNIFHHIKWWMDLKIDFGQNPLANDFATLVNDQIGSYKV